MANSFGFEERTYRLKCGTFGWAWRDDQTGENVSPLFATEQAAIDWQTERSKGCSVSQIKSP